jgi:hypothetical protein
VFWIVMLIFVVALLASPALAIVAARLRSH